VDALLTEHGVGPEAVAYIGDDLVDIPAMARAGLAIAVADAAPEVKALAHVVTRKPGGHGAVRECVELILRAQGAWDAAVDAYVRDRGGASLAGGRRNASGRSRPRRPS
jgi:3-deoxy-D-manno-octulosonate 8-phosphate phosphatase (KDO 8-P phosphatase)